MSCSPGNPCTATSYPPWAWTPSNQGALESSHLVPSLWVMEEKLRQDRGSQGDSPQLPSLPQASQPSSALEQLLLRASCLPLDPGQAPEGQTGNPPRPRTLPRLPLSFPFRRKRPLQLPGQAPQGEADVRGESRESGVGSWPPAWLSPGLPSPAEAHGRGQGGNQHRWTQDGPVTPSRSHKDSVGLKPWLV